MSLAEPIRRNRGPLRVLVVNVNTSDALTDALGRAAADAAAPRTEVVALTPTFGPESVESRFEAALSTVGVLDCVRRFQQPYDGVVLAGFGEPGREALQEMLDVPVVDITDAAVHLASLVAPVFSIVTTLPRAVSQIAERLTLNGLVGRCRSIRPIGVPVLGLDADPAPLVEAIVREAERAIEEDGAEAICLGCAGMAPLTATVAGALPIPVVDGVGAAIGLVETLINLRLSTSKLTTYAPPDRDKQLLGWPLNSAAALRPEPALSRGAFTNSIQTTGA